MKALLIKDMYIISNRIIAILLLIVFYTLANPTFSITFSGLLGAYLPMTAFFYDEQSHWSKYALMLPYSKFDLVFEKYLLGYICLSVSVITSFCTNSIFTLFSSTAQGINVSVLLFAFLTGIYFVAINTPILIIFGVDKGRLLSIAMIVLIAGLGDLPAEFYEEIFTLLGSFSHIAFLALGILLNIFSVSLTQKYSFSKG